MTGFDRNNHAVRPAGSKQFALDRRDGKIAGVCGGIANYLGVNPLIVRAIFLAGTLFGFGSFLVIYLVIWLLAK
jgi:phage shock protein PspC (stress-responsive transcriptional regulator)